MSRELAADDVRVGDAYERARGEQRRVNAELQRHRRVSLAGVLSVVFESRETIRSALEEMLRIERPADPERVRSGTAAFNAVLPPGTGLVATVYIDVADPAELAQKVVDLEDVQRHLYLEIGGTRVGGVADEAAADAEPAAAWQVTFPLREEQRAVWEGDAGIAVGVDHPACSARAVLDEEQRRALGAEL